MAPTHIDPVVPLDDASPITLEHLSIQDQTPSSSQMESFVSSAFSTISTSTPSPLADEFRQPPRLTPDEEEKALSFFRASTLSQRKKDTKSWVWKYGLDIQDQDEGTRRWVCMICVKKNGGAKPMSYIDKNLGNAKKHLVNDHQIPSPTGKLEPRGIKQKPHSIADPFALDTTNAADRSFANKMIRNFDRGRFQQLVANWIVEANLPFRVAEHPALRKLFEYLNPAVATTNANITGKTVARRIIEEYNKHKGSVIQTLKRSPGQIHIAFDGARTRNRKAVQGIVAFFRNENNQPLSVVLGVPELDCRHTGVNIASYVKEIIESFEIQNKIGYFVLDNASNNNTAMESLGAELRINGQERRVRCFGHIINLAAKALLFGNDASAFEEELSNRSIVSQEEHARWIKKGPVGKVHIWVVATHNSDILTKSLLELQRRAFQASDDPKERLKKPVTTILDVPTRWLSSFYMIKRALKLRQFYEHHRLEALQRWQKENPNARGGRGRVTNSAKYPAWLSDKARITDDDWAVLQSFHDVLQPFHETMMELEGDGKQRMRCDGTVKAFGLMPKVLLAFEFLLKTLETAKAAAVEQEQDGSMFAININLGWSKLEEYYSRLQESPVYYAALALHPRHRFQPFEIHWGKDHPDWVTEAKAAVRKLWKDEYSQRPVENVNNEPAEAETSATSAFQQFCVDSSLASASLLNDPNALDEFDRWFINVDPSDRTVDDALDY